MIERMKKKFLEQTKVLFFFFDYHRLTWLDKDNVESLSPDTLGNWLSVF